MSRDIDLDNLKPEDESYIADRPWLKDELFLQTGVKFEDTDFGGSEDVDEDGYASWEYADLQKEVASRNEDREEDDQIKPKSRKAEDLVAALEADDDAE